MQQILFEFPEGSPQVKLAKTTLALEAIDGVVKSEINDLQEGCNDLFKELADPPIESECDRQIPVIFFHHFVKAKTKKLSRCEAGANINLSPDGATFYEVLLKIAFGYFTNCSGFMEALDLFNKSEKYVNWKNVKHKETYGRTILRAQGRLQTDSEDSSDSDLDNEDSEDSEYLQGDDSEDWTDIDE